MPSSYHLKLKTAMKRINRYRLLTNWQGNFQSRSRSYDSIPSRFDTNDTRDLRRYLWSYMATEAGIFGNDIALSCFVAVSFAIMTTTQCYSILRQMVHILLYS